MISIGLTGNAGSGKTTALDFFISRGIDGISTDAINSDLRHQCPYLTTALEQTLNTELADEHGLVDTGLLRQQIFSSREARIAVERLLHPLIMENLELQLSVLPEKDYCIVEIPLLYEAELLSCVDIIVLVTSEQDILLDRLAARASLTRDDAQGILKNQLADSHKFQYSSDIVLNNDSQEAFLQYLNEIYRRYS
jgi:dephospho-CoA kinase